MIDFFAHFQFPNFEKKTRLSSLHFENLSHFHGNYDFVIGELNLPSVLTFLHTFNFRILKKKTRLSSLHFENLSHFHGNYDFVIGELNLPSV